MIDRGIGSLGHASASRACEETAVFLLAMQAFAGASGWCFHASKRKSGRLLVKCPDNHSPPGYTSPAVFLATARFAKEVGDKSYIGSYCLLTLAIFADYASRRGTALGWGGAVWYMPQLVLGTSSPFVAGTLRVPVCPLTE